LCPPAFCEINDDVYFALEHRVSGVDVAGDANATRGSVETWGWGPNWLSRQRVSIL